MGRNLSPQEVQALQLFSSAAEAAKMESEGGVIMV